MPSQNPPMSHDAAMREFDANVAWQVRQVVEARKRADADEPHSINRAWAQLKQMAA